MKPLEDSVLVHGHQEPHENRRTLAALALTALVGGALATLAATPIAATPAPGAATRPVRAHHLGGFSDSATFVRFHENEVWGTIGFTWRPDGHVESRTLRGRPAARADLIRIEPDANGDWSVVWIGVSRDSAWLERLGSRAALHAEGRVDTLDLGEGVMLDGTPGLLAQVPRVYDRGRGGVQRIPVLVLPMHQSRATVARLGSTRRSVAGRSQTFERWRYEAPGVRYQLWTDRLGRVCLANDSTERFGFVRQGYEALLGAKALTPAPPMR